MKKRTKKLTAIGLAAVMTAALLSGCGGKTQATPENLLRDMTDKAEKVESTVMNVKFNIKLSSGDDSLVSILCSGPLAPILYYCLFNLVVWSSGLALKQSTGVNLIFQNAVNCNRAPKSLRFVLEGCSLL